MGSFRLAAGRLHHHKHFNFAESREETVWPSLRHSCRSELTRQGISLTFVAPASSRFNRLNSRGRTFLPASACRHAGRTLSSLIPSAWLVVSEDSWRTPGLSC